MRPDRATLAALYCDQRLTTRRIGEMYGVRHITVRRWLTACGIELRPSGRGLANRGVEAPTRDELARLVHDEHQSYDQIAARYGVDRSAVQHWLTRHDIPRPAIWDTRRKGIRPDLPDAETLAAMYASGMSLEEIGKRYGVSERPIRELCRRHGIEVRRAGFNNSGTVAYRTARGEVVRSVYEMRVADWLHCRGIPYEYEPRLPFDRRYRADFLANGWYIEVWGVKGNDAYEERRQLKVRAYWAYAMPLIELGPQVSLDRNLAPCLAPASEPSADVLRERAQERERLKRAGARLWWLDNRGERCGTAKLTESKVLEIADRLRAGETFAALATAMGVSASAIQGIANGRTWSHVTGGGIRVGKGSRQTVIG